MAAIGGWGPIIPETWSIVIVSGLLVVIWWDMVDVGVWSSENGYIWMMNVIEIKIN